MPELDAAPAPAPKGRAEAVLRVDELSLELRLATPDGVRFEILPSGTVDASKPHALPIFDGWLTNAELVVTARGVTRHPTTFALVVADGPRTAPIDGTFGEANDDGLTPFAVTLALPLSEVAARVGSVVSLALGLSVRPKPIALVTVELVSVRAPGPHFASLDLLEATDALLVGAAERRLYDLQSPEEGFWAGTGKWRLRLFAEWGKAEGEGFVIETKPREITHRHAVQNDPTDAVWEDPTRRAGGRRTYAELTIDTSHPGLGEIPPEGRDVPLDLVVRHGLTFHGHSADLVWRAALPLRLRDPRPKLAEFQRLSAVGIDFGTSATVAALYQKGQRSLLRLGAAEPQTSGEKSAENPTYLLVEDHERLWAEQADGARRFPHLLRAVRGSHAALAAQAEAPNAVIGELKSLPERIAIDGQSPQLRDRERQRDFLLDEPRVRVLIRTYAYLLGRAINRPGQDVYLHYWLTHPAKFGERERKLIEEEIHAGILQSIPAAIDASLVTVAMRASEPEAFAAEVCPELAASPAVEPLVAKHGELRFAVFDFGGGTLDIACGRFRPATEAELDDGAANAVIETLQATGDEHLGGDYLTHELAFLTHQHDKHLAEMEEKEVPMLRPETVPPNDLVRKPYLYKRSVAARQNRVRFQTELGLEQVKHGPAFPPKRVDELVAARVDGGEVRLTSLRTDLAGLHAELSTHLLARIREGAKLLRSMLATTRWDGDESAPPGDWRAQGVVILLAGNSSRSEFVEEALRQELGIPDLVVYRPGDEATFTNVVLYETKPTASRGASVVGIGPKTAVAMGALKIANREVSLVRRTPGFRFFLGDLRGFPPKFVALVPMGASASDPASPDAKWVDFGRWDADTPLRATREYEPGKMTSGDGRLMILPTGLPSGEKGRLRVCVVSPDEVLLSLEREGHEPSRRALRLSKALS